MGTEGVCSLRLPQHSLLDKFVRFECRHMMASRWTPREAPNFCPTAVVAAVMTLFVGLYYDVVFPVVGAFFVGVFLRSCVPP